MAYWKLKGRELANCNCEYGCNCQFGGLPDKGNCQAVFAMAIDQGIHGDTDLSGLNIAAVFSWPGPIHEGHGECAAFVDERATDAQRNALLTIMTGGDTDPFATVFAVFASTIETMHPPGFVPIEFDVDVDGRTGRLRIEGHVEMDGEPIRSPVNGAEVRARINLPDGFEYEIAEIGSGSSRSFAPMKLEHSHSYGQFANLHLDSHGVVRA
ncbi:DUF1326 domain-containing protein [Novosphingobium pentaromativorans]|uniref:DUF1326 domain-containing protein n=1 Tax=Novosphingobium pentaromativorans US6-1 TaxID=1088721 RepID=G6EB06_9SPHN|nr:DUF1326 domain-containing protein [Novosphingobium pentaromativorans]AIT80544.1 hypothetical protein JI59_12535 [Novosphingobium pentaromativorans US6-1]EHJ61473.1 hypothetical protein NSU_1527 [Novosphingobium pentaromativorans US6-1]